ncbi:hypothetical protein BJ684DRAFT_11916, partial [Piptocephalis cylindrospora]
APTPFNTPLNAAPITSGAEGSSPSAAPPPAVAAAAGDLFANNQALVSMLQGRLGRLIGHPSSYLDSLSPPVRRRIRGVRGLQKQHTELERQFHQEVLELEKRYQRLYAPLYERRRELIAGAGQEVTDAEIAAGKEEDVPEDPQETEDSSDAAAAAVQPATGIPEFWLTALKNHQLLAELITDADEDVLKKLTDIRLIYTDERPGFQLAFDFAENDYFTDPTLTKTYYYQQAGSIGDLVYERAEGCSIQWREGRDLSVTIQTKRQRHKATGAIRTVQKTVPAQTFFEFFKTLSPSRPSASKEEGSEEVAEDEEPEEDAEEDEEEVERDYELGEEFKEKIIPHAIDWFTGEALQYEGFDDFEEDDYEYDSTDEEEEEEEDEEDE